MTATAPVAKVTYTSTNVDMEAFHRAFDAALANIRANLGKRYPLFMLFVTLPVWGLILVVAVSFHAACAAVNRWRHPWTDFGGGSSGEG